MGEFDGLQWSRKLQDGCDALCSRQEASSRNVKRGRRGTWALDQRIITARRDRRMPASILFKHLIRIQIVTYAEPFALAHERPFGTLKGEVHRCIRSRNHP